MNLLESITKNYLKCSEAPCLSSGIYVFSAQFDPFFDLVHLYQNVNYMCMYVEHWSRFAMLDRSSWTGSYAVVVGD